MKKNALILVVMISSLKAQTGNVGINTRNPTATFHVLGNVRLEHATMGEGRILRSHANGNIDWALPYELRRIEGTAVGNGVSLSDDNPKFTQGYIDLPSGTWIVRATFPIQQDNKAVNILSSGEAVQLDSFFSDSSTSAALSADYVSTSAEYISGVLKGTGILEMVDGSVILDNKTATTKRYYYWVKKTSTPASAAGKTTNSFAASWWGENNFYAFPITK